MATILFITGGQRSGKSRYAMELAQSLSPHPVYLATARPGDEDFRQRIERHRADRGEQWITIEKPMHLDELSFQESDVVVLDCLTLWLTNIFEHHQYHWQDALDHARNEWDKFTSGNFTLIAVSNEVGMSIHPETAAGRKFIELQGFMNQHVAAMASAAWLMVAGINIKIK